MNVFNVYGGSGNSVNSKNKTLNLRNRPIKVGCIGDSITRNQINISDLPWGKSYMWYGRNWALRTGMKLGGKAWFDIYSVEGYSGKRTDEILDLMLPAGSVINPLHVKPQPIGVISCKPDIVIELTGTNDNYFEINTKEQMVAGRKAIWERLIAHDITPIAMSMLPNDLTDHRNTRVQEWNEAVKIEAEKLGILFVDIYTPCAEGTKWKEGYNWNNGVPDVIGGLHPGAEACEVIATTLAKAINSVIGTRINTPTVMANSPIYSKPYNSALKSTEYRLFDDGVFSTVGGWVARYDDQHTVSTRNISKDENFSKYGNVLTIDYNLPDQSYQGYGDTASPSISVTPGEIYGVFFKYEFIAKNNTDAVQVGISYNNDYNNLITFFTGGSGNDAASSTIGASIKGDYYQEIVIPDGCYSIEIFNSCSIKANSVNNSPRVKIANVGTVKIHETFNLNDITSTPSQIDSTIKDHIFKYGKEKIEVSNTTASITYPTTKESIYSKFYSIFNNVDCFQESGYLEKLGNNWAQYANIYQLGQGNVGFGKATVSMSISFMTDSLSLVLKIYYNPQINIAIDDVLWSDTTNMQGVTSTDSAPNGWIKLEFPSQKIRKVTIRWSASGNGFGGVYVLPTRKVWSPNMPSPKVVYVGDSLSTGASSNVAGSVYTDRIDQLCGFVKSNVCGFGGTGFVNKVDGFSQNYIERIQQVIDFNPDIVFVQCSVNDDSYPSTTIKTKAKEYITALKALMGNKPIVILGVCGRYTTAAFNNETAVKTAIEELAYSNVYFIPSVTRIDPLIVGDGRQGAELGDGNADYCIAPDGTHFTPYGFIYYAERMARDIKRIFI